MSKLKDKINAVHEAWGGKGMSFYLGRLQAVLESRQVEDTDGIVRVKQFTLEQKQQFKEKLKQTRLNLDAKLDELEQEIK